MNQRWYEPPVKMSFKQRLAKLRQAVLGRLSLMRRNSGSPNNPSLLGNSTLVVKLKKKATNLVFAFGHWFQLTVLPVLRRFDWKLIQGIFAVLVVSFFLANSISTFAANGVLALTRSAGKTPKKKAASSAASGADETTEPAIPVSVILPNPQKANTVSLSKEIIGRNLFNSEGKIPPEENKEDSKKTKKDLSLNFDNVACVAGEIPVQITGTIYTGDPRKSFVILKDPKITDADIYKPGDAIIDHEDYEIYKVERGSLEIRKGDTKICVAIKGFEKKGMMAASSEMLGKDAVPSDTKSFEFDLAFINQELGNGFSNIMNCARLIPDADATGKVRGFKLSSIATSCLFDRIELKNGDLVTEVNGVSLTDLSQGIRIYQSLQEDRTTTINALRDGQPITRTVRVK
jgi:type II secretory pathway component PulC